MKKQEELIITKENYKGYVKLYEFKQKILHLTSKELVNYIWLFLTGMVGYCIIGLILKSFFFSSLLLEATVAFAAYEVGILGHYAVKSVTESRKEKKRLLKEYPYLNVNVKDDVLEDSLEKVGILTKEYKNTYCLVHNNLSSYENYVRCEEEKEKYLNETKWDGYVVNPPIEVQELTKAKQKVKRLSNRF